MPVIIFQNRKKTNTSVKKLTISVEIHGGIVVEVVGPHSDPLIFNGIFRCLLVMNDIVSGKK